nr:mediator of RNA polymerase II transcription subunit 6 isoform X5 [Tursiops truncatus]
MQRLTLEHLNQMVGVEYILLHAQEPILFIIRKQQRQSPTQVIPLADYYIIAGVIYQAPDLGSVINSRVLTVVHGIQSAFDEAMSYCRYHPSKGYWWHFKDHEEQDKVKPKVKRKEEPSSIFQRQRVDALLLDLRQKFPPRFVQALNDWMMPSCTGEGDLFFFLLSLLIQMLISSRNTDTPRNHVLAAIWASLSPVKMVHRINCYRDINKPHISRGVGSKKLQPSLSYQMYHTLLVRLWGTKFTYSAGGKDNW